MNKITDRFMSKVKKTDSCWLWEGCTSTSGYGFFCLGKVMSAHRASYILAKGPIPKGAFICHSCDVKLCVNPDHLYKGDRFSNARDAVSRGQQPRGARHGSKTKPETIVRGERVGTSKRTAAEVVDMRRMRANGYALREIAAKYGCSIGGVFNAVSRETWRHIT